MDRMSCVVTEPTCAFRCKVNVTVRKKTTRLKLFIFFVRNTSEPLFVCGPLFFIWVKEEQYWSVDSYPNRKALPTSRKTTIWQGNWTGWLSFFTVLVLGAFFVSISCLNVCAVRPEIKQPCCSCHWLLCHWLWWWPFRRVARVECVANVKVRCTIVTGGLFAILSRLERFWLRGPRLRV